MKQEEKVIAKAGIIIDYLRFFKRDGFSHPYLIEGRQP